MELPEDRDDLSRHEFAPVEVGDGVGQYALRDEIIEDIRLPRGSLQTLESMATAMAKMEEATRETQRTLKNMTKRLEDNILHHRKEPFSAFCDELVLLALGYAKTGDSDFVGHIDEITQFAYNPVFLSFPFLTVSINAKEEQNLLNAIKVGFNLTLDIHPRQLVMLKTAFRKLPLTEPLLRYFQIKDFVLWGCEEAKKYLYEDYATSVEKLARDLERDFWGMSFGEVDLFPRSRRPDAKMKGSNLRGRREDLRECCNGFAALSQDGFTDMSKFEETKMELSLICGCEVCEKYCSDVAAVRENTMEQAGRQLFG
jgi:hypothetical protein